MELKILKTEDCISRRKYFDIFEINYEMLIHYYMYLYFATYMQVNIYKYTNTVDKVMMPYEPATARGMITPDYLLLGNDIVFTWNHDLSTKLKLNF